MVYDVLSKFFNNLQFSFFTLFRNIEISNSVSEKA